MLFFSSFLPRIAESVALTIWSQAGDMPAAKARRMNGDLEIESFPAVAPSRFRLDLLRRITDYAWDYHASSLSRSSFRRLRLAANEPAYVRLLERIGNCLGFLRLHGLCEKFVERLLVSQNRSPEALGRLQSNGTQLLVVMSPFRNEEPALTAAAKKLGIPVLAFITSWDNISTKSRLIFDYDGYLVWSPAMADDLSRHYPHTKGRFVRIVGAPQFDVFFQAEFHQTRDEFCREHGLVVDKKIILYSLGSPNLLKEHYGALSFADRLKNGALGDVQMLVRPHPLFAGSSELQAFARYEGSVVIQQNYVEQDNSKYRYQDAREIRRWVNTFRHADVVVNLSSTVAIDAAICDKPVVNLDFDPEPGQPNQALVKDVNHVWTHFKPIAESGGVWLANDMDEVVHAVRQYLAHPELHREKRRWMAEHVCGYIDGKCGERMAQAILDFVQKRSSTHIAPENLTTSLGSRSDSVVLACK
jgi:hypothetical protein